MVATNPVVFYGIFTKFVFIYIHFCCIEQSAERKALMFDYLFNTFKFVICLH